MQEILKKKKLFSNCHTTTVTSNVLDFYFDFQNICQFVVQLTFGPAASYVKMGPETSVLDQHPTAKGRFNI